jgi:hypothetical protein
MLDRNRNIVPNHQTRWRQSDERPTHHYGSKPRQLGVAGRVCVLGCDGRVGGNRQTKTARRKNAAQDGALLWCGMIVMNHHNSARVVRFPDTNK